MSSGNNNRVCELPLLASQLHFKRGFLFINFYIPNQNHKKIELKALKGSGVVVVEVVMVMVVVVVQNRPP